MKRYLVPGAIILAIAAGLAIYSTQENKAQPHASSSEPVANRPANHQPESPPVAPAGEATNNVTAARVAGPRLQTEQVQFGPTSPRPGEMDMMFDLRQEMQARLQSWLDAEHLDQNVEEQVLTILADAQLQQEVLREAAIKARYPSTPVTPKELEQSRDESRRMLESNEIDKEMLARLQSTLTSDQYVSFLEQFAKVELLRRSKIFEIDPAAIAQASIAGH